MQKYVSILVFFSMLPIFTMAQLPLNYEMRQTIDLFNTTKSVSGEWRTQLTENDIQGSAYLNDDFINGTIYTVQKQQYSDIPLRYNIYNDALEFKIPSGEVMELAAPEIVEIAVFGSNQLVYCPYVVSNKNKKGFFVVLEQGKVSLYSKPGIVFREGTEPAAYKDPEPPKFIKKSDEYYIRVGIGEAQLIGSKKDLISVFPDNQDKIQSFMSKNKTKTNKPESLKELVSYYNSL